MPAMRMTPMSSATVNVVAGRMGSRLLALMTTYECQLALSVMGRVRRRRGRAKPHQ